jgi:hypothetical protein
MSKKSNTLLFILGATVFNIVTTILCVVLLGAVYFTLIAPRLSNPETSAALALPVIFIGAIVLSFLIYRFILKLIMKKVDVEKHFDPIFGGRKPPRN